MSGIAAIVHPTGEAIDESLIRLMAGSMAIRGPDEQSYRIGRRVALAQSTLTTKNNVNRHYSFNNNGIWITANARIDGRNELIAKLDKATYSDHLSDEQLIIQAYHQWGVNCLDHLIGDFSFILWDVQNKRLFCATDQFGVAPLFYAKTRLGLCLSNSLNTIRLHPDISDELNEATLADYLISRMNHTRDTTIFKSINRLPAAHKLLFQDGNLHIEPYWSPEPQTSIQFKKPEEYIDEFNHLLRIAVNDRLSTDVIGTDLSGGMDSTSVTALAHDLLTETKQPFKLHAYTLGSNGLLDDLESSLASQVVESRNIEHHIYTPDKCRLIPESMTPHLISPEPSFMRRSNHQFTKLEHLQRYHGTLLTGFGGDPLLHGRPIYKHDIKSPIDIFSLIKQAIYHYTAYRQLPPLGLMQRGFTHQGKAQPLDMTALLPEWLHADFINRSGLAERLQSQHLLQNTLNSSQTGMTSSGLWRRLFDWNDPGFTHIPVKVCHPFFDIRLLEFALQLPPFPWKHKKYLLRTAMSQYLPTAITNRAKTPVQGNRIKALLDAQGLSNMAHDLLINPHLDAYIDSKKLIESFTNNHDTPPIKHKSLMTTLTLSYWLNHYQSIPKTIIAHSRNIAVRKITETDISSPYQ